MDLVYSQGLFGRPYFLPPGVPPERVAALRKAFMDTFQDEALLADAKKGRFDNEPLSGEEMQALVAKAYALPEDRDRTCKTGTGLPAAGAMTVRTRSAKERVSWRMLRFPILTLTGGSFTIRN